MHAKIKLLIIYNHWLLACKILNELRLTLCIQQMWRGFCYGLFLTYQTTLTPLFLSTLFFVRSTFQVKMFCGFLSLVSNLTRLLISFTSSYTFNAINFLLLLFSQGFNDFAIFSLQNFYFRLNKCFWLVTTIFILL